MNSDLKEDIYEEIIKTAGHLLVTGGPGSGKTTTALKKAVRYIEEKKLDHGQSILFLSFSKAAISRIHQTSSSIFKTNDYQKFLNIQTFHSFFWEIIKTYGYLLGTPRMLKVISPHEEDALRRGRDHDNSTWLVEKNELCNKNGLVSFDTFASLAMEIILRSEAIRNILNSKFPFIIVDESQDTDTEQWECVKILSDKSDIILLADIDQQIYDYRTNVSSERLNEMNEYLRPTVFKLENQNHRSFGTEITTFAKDLKDSTPKNEPYNGVSAALYRPQASERDKKIRQSIGILMSKIEQETGKKPNNIAILATWGRGVKIISQALRGTEVRKEIKHRVQFDETSAFLASKVVAFLLEPKSPENLHRDLIELLVCMGDMAKAKGRENDWKKYDKWCGELKIDKIPKRGKTIPGFEFILQEIYGSRHSGNPEKDWLRVKNLLINSNVKEIIQIGKHAEYLMAFNRGLKISSGLTRVWQKTGSYIDARTILNSAIIESQIISDYKEMKGIHVMTIHKAKGKEFDGVILFNDTNSSPFILKGDSPPFNRSRKLLFVGVTRAKFHTMILKCVTDSSSIMNGFNLG